MNLSFRQPQYMWLNQLLYDNDVLAQLHAIQNLKNFKAKEVLTGLNSILEQPQIFYRVRTRAAYMLAFLTSSNNDWIGLDFLFKFFKENFFYKEPAQVRMTPYGLTFTGQTKRLRILS